MFENDFYEFVCEFIKNCEFYFWKEIIFFIYYLGCDCLLVFRRVFVYVFDFINGNFDLLINFKKFF